MNQKSSHSTEYGKGNEMSSDRQITMAEYVERGFECTSPNVVRNELPVLPPIDRVARDIFYEYRAKRYLSEYVVE